MVAALIAVIVGTAVISSATGGADYRNEFTLPGTETEAVANLLRDAGLSDQSGDSGTMVLHARTGAVADYENVVEPVLQAACDNPRYLIASITSPWGQLGCPDSTRDGGDSGRPPGWQLISADGTTGLITVTLTAPGPRGIGLARRAAPRFRSQGQRTSVTKCRWPRETSISSRPLASAAESGA